MTDLYTLAEVAERTGFALRTLQRDARAGKFEHIHRGRQRLMTEQQIAQLLDQSTVTTPAKQDSAADRLAAVKGIIARSRK